MSITLCGNIYDAMYSYVLPACWNLCLLGSMGLFNRPPYSHGSYFNLFAQKRS